MAPCHHSNPISDATPLHSLSNRLYTVADGSMVVVSRSPDQVSDPNASPVPESVPNPDEDRRCNFFCWEDDLLKKLKDKGYATNDDKDAKPQVIEDNVVESERF
ncbi:hypothetical protein RIF29_39059 [Crotalaria pallida]|uniref:Uncharacterized protein n=1 Tax=Crotalaria pallida TaxID=3830 RepID=A0AAN9E5W0_CROPI